MSIFSRTTESNASGTQPVPRDILNAVNVMKGTSTFQEEKPAEKPVANSFQGASPFLSAEEVGKGQMVALERESAEAKKESLAQQNDEELRVAPKQSSPLDSKKRSLIALVGAVVIVAGMAVAWYFLWPQEEAVVPDSGEESPVSLPVEVPAVVLPYVPNAPNYLSLDPETVTTETLQTMLSEAGAKMMAVNMAQPVEFLLTDKNNNPIAFSRFAYLMNIEFSEEVLASFGEPFSLFLYNDGGKMRTGLVLTFIDPAKSEKLLMTKEKSLPYLFRGVLFQGLSFARELSFRSGVYKDQPVRFVNIDTAQGVSFDYAFRDKNWFIGTSKETLWAMLDKQQ
ncbi:MAG: hypothetical protein KBD27_00825 [Candidatus Moranbacteria bacterium]|nr:hypothetical protein [Candidatus Moranbacteria bacterium]